MTYLRRKIPEAMEAMSSESHGIAAVGMKFNNCKEYRREERRKKAFESREEDKEKEVDLR